MLDLAKFPLPNLMTSQARTDDENVSLAGTFEGISRGSTPNIERGAKCNFCDSTDGLEWHHIIPHALGGNDERPNLLLVCNVHHAILHGMRGRGNISALTKAGLARAKAKGVKLGGPNLHRVRDIGSAKNATKADEFATLMKPLIQGMLASGMSYRAIAEELNENGTKTARGGFWSAATVSNIIARWKAPAKRPYL